MIRQQFSVEHYWKVIVFWNLDYDFFDVVAAELAGIGFSLRKIKRIWKNMSSGEAKGVTCSSIYYHTSIVLFNKHYSKSDYISSIVHEAEHVKQAMLDAYQVEDEGEPPAYTIGYLVMRMWNVFRRML